MAFFTTHSFKGPEGQEDMPYLLGAGPRTTSRTVKIAMLADWNPRDAEFQAMAAHVRKRLLQIAGGESSHDCVILPGPSSCAVEAVLGSLAPAGRRKTLVAINGAAGDRAGRVLDRIGRPWLGAGQGSIAAVRCEDLVPALDSDRNFTHVFLVHCETATGVVNDAAAIAREVKARGRIFMLDAAASFGAVPLHLAADAIDVLTSTSSTCIEGVPGFSFVLCRRDLLEECKGRSHSLALDLHEYWQDPGQLRFTPPTHALAAFSQALLEHEAEGGVEGRGLRYQSNAKVLVDGMRGLGFEPLLPDAERGPVIQAFHAPADGNFDSMRFAKALRSRGFAIAPGDPALPPGFRIGTAGAVDETVMQAALNAIKAVLAEMKVTALKPAGQ